MAGTDTSNRTPPERVFERYVLTRLVDGSAGLTSVSDSFFTQVNGPGTSTKFDAFVGAGAPGTDNAVSVVTPLGFEFQIDGVTYNSWCASTNGWMVLVDPDTGTFVETEVISGSVEMNNNIRPTFTSRAVVLSPWFDNLRNRLSDHSQLSTSPFSFSTTKIDRLQRGFEPATALVNPSSYGVSYYVDPRSSMGRRLIVRWSSISDRGWTGSIVRFEVVVYENGTIEYRYAPKDRLIVTGSAQQEGATVGVFMPNGTNRWRDFSQGLGYNSDSRQASSLGGYSYDPSYTDSVITGSLTLTASYSIGLVPFRNWPGRQDAGCILTFSPPKLGRRVLPRVAVSERDVVQTYPLVSRTGDVRMGTFLRSFDDRRAACYAVSGTSSTSVISYPTTLTRFFGDTGVGVLERQDLFSGDLMTTGSHAPAAIDQYVHDVPVRSVAAFNEVARHEQGPGANTAFFLTGTADRHVLAGFQQSLRAKTHVKFTLPIVSPVTMPGNSASIYYYNSDVDAWEIPSNSSYVISSGASVPPSPNPYAGGDIVTSLSGAGAVREDARGFGPVGNPMSSGSVVMDAITQSDPVFGLSSPYVFNDSTRVLGKEYVKSIRNNREYRATSGETFTIPINAPFLIEKAVFDVPLAAGRGWFEDKTQCFLPLSDTARRFDFGGPALTFALFRQVKLGKGADALTTLDLILTGTVTHVYDNTSSVVVSNFPPISNDFQIRPVGFLAYAGPPAGLVDDRGLLSFTGSVKVETTALNTAGMSVVYKRTFMSSSDDDNVAAVTSLLTQPLLVLKNDVTFPTTSVSVAFASPFGRSGTGFRQSGRAVLGNEYVTWQGMDDQAASIVPNQFYVGQAGLTAQQVAALASVPFTASAATVVPLGSHFPSPYLVMPGDMLVLSVSKVRPFAYDGPSTFSGSLPHDVTLTTGDINITLYGSQLREGKEFHDTLNAELGSNAVHESVGMDPVLDQFDVSYVHERSGSFYDHGMFGALTTFVSLTSERPGLGPPAAPDAYAVVQTIRDRRVSWVNARNYAQLGTGSSDLDVTTSKAFRAEPWWEMAPDVRLAQFTDSAERFWDSMMPSISECFSADGCNVFITPNGTFGSSYQIDTGPSGSSGFNPRTTKMGWIWMDYNVPSLLAGDYGPLINTNWSKAFPFEPRYRNASRQVNVERSLVANKMYGGSPSVQTISPVRVNGFAFGTTTKATALFTSIPLPGSVCWDWLTDVDLSSTNVFGYYVTGSAATNDMARGLFGFGDRNTCFIYNGTLLGTNHAVDTRDVEGPHPDGVGIDYDNNFFRISPSIRGWKYGVHSGIPTFSKAYWRPNRFGQFRDMLEQRPFGKFFRKVDKGTPARVGGSGVQPGVVTVTFIDPSSGRRTSAENTWSNNLSTECTSSVPFHDGLAFNRPTIDPRILNLNPNVIRHDARGNIHIA